MASPVRLALGSELRFCESFVTLAENFEIEISLYGGRHPGREAS